MNAILDWLPRFTIISNASTDGAIKWIGHFGPSENVPSGYAFLCTDKRVFIRGKLAIDAATKTATFQTNDSTQGEYLKIGISYICFDGYWGERAALVFDESRLWTRTKFEPKDSMRIFPDGKQEIQAGAWDHEHCEICWEKIALFGDCNHFGYRDQGDQWVCEQCYETYIVPKSLDFITK